MPILRRLFPIGLFRLSGPRLHFFLEEAHECSASRLADNMERGTGRATNTDALEVLRRTADKVEGLAATMDS